jgi:hypothetical protein
MRSFRKNKQGIVIGMVIMIATIFVVAIMWIVTMPAVTMIWANIAPNLPEQDIPIMNMLNNTCGWTLLALIIGTLVYGAALAGRRDPVDVPGY